MSAQAALEDQGVLLPHHVELLAAGAIPADVAIDAGTYSVSILDGLPVALRWARSVPGILFRHHPIDGDSVPQYRPDNPLVDGEGRARKYLFPADTAAPLNVVPAMRDRLGHHRLVLIVEGTKQTLAAVAHAPDDVLVVGVAGCWGWSRDGAPTAELDRLGIDGRPVIVAFDADVSSNAKVHDAAHRLGEHLELLGAETVRYLTLPASGSVGLDDFLGGRENPGAVLARLIDRAGPLPKRPKATRSTAPDDPGRFFDTNGLRALDLANAVRAGGHHAVGPDGGIWAYKAGVYHDDDPVPGAVAELLGQRYRDTHRRNAHDVIVAGLHRDSLVLGDTEPDGIVNTANGMLSIRTGELRPHDPALLSRVQVPVGWDPKATAPAFDDWLTGRCGTQAEDLIEAAGLMLCPWIGQRKVLFIFGPARSGKSTLLRVLEALAGASVCSVTLHQLATNRFAAAGLYGKLLNSAGDLSDHHVDDLALFKALTGDDLIAGERKFRDPFTFHNRALFAFSANTPPTVGETSRAYLARVRPFLFPTSVEGAEDPTLEGELMAELPGILVRLVEGAQRWLERGGYGIGDQLVADEFAQASDVAAQFAAQCLTADPGGFVPGKAMFDGYTEWTAQNGRGRLGRNKFLARAENTLGPRERNGESGSLGWKDWRLLDSAAWSDPDPAARFARFLTTSPREENEGEEEREDSSRGEVGAERAKRAAPDPGPDEADDPGEDWF
ncbi:phage/plasmid primase, P4 family [Iamia sp.]|uniref:phage/plasmid primase, P4 family n=1 Tax=Iamia sp. TaxID=2722710 RepID=UPI002CE27907|nr:phage/plasmid primase, P4 family [Iamia sp.]HXH56557.1 phage/plasmid primase, P4 family [Iamia sp.]